MKSFAPRLACLSATDLAARRALPATQRSVRAARPACRGRLCQESDAARRRIAARRSMISRRAGGENSMSRTRQARMTCAAGSAAPRRDRPAAPSPPAPRRPPVSTPPSGGREDRRSAVRFGEVRPCKSGTPADARASEVGDTGLEPTGRRALSRYLALQLRFGALRCSEIRSEWDHERDHGRCRAPTHVRSGRTRAGSAHSRRSAAWS
jgi:hypothetical protein